MSTSRTSTQPLPVAPLNWAATLIQQLHELEKHDTDKHASECFQAQPDDPWAPKSEGRASALRLTGLRCPDPADPPSSSGTYGRQRQARRVWATCQDAPMLELVSPTTLLHAAFMRCRDDWGPGVHEDGFGLDDKQDLDSPDGFAAWVDERLRFSHPVGTPCPPERHGSPRWIVEDGQVLGAIALRHTFDDDLGHIGYGVRPSARRRGVASWALGEMLAEARAALGVDRVLVPCLSENTASARTIERCGGVLDGIRDTDHGPVRRYWVAV